MTKTNHFLVLFHVKPQVCFNICVKANICISELIYFIKMTLLLNPTLILTTALVTFVMQALWNFWFDVPLLTDGTSTETETAIARNLNILQSHPRCGLTSGGREECWWGCDRQYRGGYFTVIFIIELQLSLSHSHS